MTIQDSIGAEYVGIYRTQGLAFASGALGATYKGTHKFGRNDAAGTGYEDVWTKGGIYTWPQTATVISVVSSSANDTATGVGLRSVTVEGLDGSFDEVSETLTLNGASTVTGTQLFQRINRAYGVSSGTYDGTTVSSHGTITFTHNGTATAEILNSTISLGQTEVARYTVPNGYDAYVNDVDINVDSAKTAQIVFFKRENADVTSAPFTPKRVVEMWDGISGPYQHKFAYPIKFPQKTDIWFSSKAGAVSTPVDVSFDIFLIPR